MKRFYYVIIFCFLFSFTLSQENNVYHKDAIFTGVGMGTNFGGYYGIAYEYSYSKFIKSHLSVGSIYGGAKNVKLTDSFGFDIGVKYFPISYFFIGLNYGMIEFKYVRLSYGSEIIFEEFSKKNGFSFIFGLKTNLFDDKIYLGALAGYTDDKKVNNPAFVDPPFPKMGVFLGYYID